MGWYRGGLVVRREGGWNRVGVFMSERLQWKRTDGHGKLD
jgi:hypothetical protein